MCWFCDDIKKFINKSVVVYDVTTANASKEYCHFYSDDTVTLKITAGGYRGNSHILTGMRELKGLKYCPNCGEKIEDFDNCASKENDKISCKIEKLKRDVENLKKHHNDILIGDKDQLAESYIENKRKEYKGGIKMINKIFKNLWRIYTCVVAIIFIIAVIYAAVANIYMCGLSSGIGSD